MDLDGICTKCGKLDLYCQCKVSVTICKKCHNFAEECGCHLLPEVTVPKKKRHKLTEEDIRNIHYFYFEKGDMGRMCDWDEVKVRLKNSRPEIYEAFERAEIAQKTLDILLKDLKYDNT